jgi:hypothetical protein
MEKVPLINGMSIVMDVASSKKRVKKSTFTEASTENTKKWVLVL